MMQSMTDSPRRCVPTWMLGGGDRLGGHLSIHLLFVRALEFDLHLFFFFLLLMTCVIVCYLVCSHSIGHLCRQLAQLMFVLFAKDLHVIAGSVPDTDQEQGHQEDCVQLEAAVHYQSE